MLKIERLYRGVQLYRVHSVCTISANPSMPICCFNQLVWLPERWLKLSGNTIDQSDNETIVRILFSQRIAQRLRMRQVISRTESEDGDHAKDLTMGSKCDES